MMPRVGLANFLGAIVLVVALVVGERTVAGEQAGPGQRVLAFSSGVGDGRLALQAPIGRPEDIALDRSGRLFIADPTHARVRVVDTDGVIRTVAGTGEPGTQRYGHLATETQLSDPTGLAVAKDGTLFIADRGAHRIYALSPSGRLEAVALKLADGWRELNGPISIAVDDEGQVLFVAEAGNQRLLRVHLATGEVDIWGSEGPADDTPSWERPERIAWSSADQSLWVLDDFGHRLTQLSSEGKLMNQWTLPLPARGIAVDEHGALYLSIGAQVWRRAADGLPELVAGRGRPGTAGDGGPAEMAELWAPTALRVSAPGELFVLDPVVSLIRKVDASGQMHTVAGNGSIGWLGDGLPADDSTYHCADVVEGANGRLYVADSLNHRVAEIDPAGIMRTIAGLGGVAGFSGDGGPADQATLFHPTRLALAPDGALYVVDLGNKRVRRISPEGIIQSVPRAALPTVESSGDPTASLEGPFDHPEAIAVAADGSVWVLDQGSNRVVRIDGQTGTITTVLRGRLHEVSPSADSELEFVVPAELSALARSAAGSIVVEGQGAEGLPVRVEISPDGKSLASGGEYPRATVQCAPSGRSIFRVLPRD